MRAGGYNKYKVRGCCAKRLGLHNEKVRRGVWMYGVRR
jgi:hypothetical protein